MRQKRGSYLLCVILGLLAISGTANGQGGVALEDRLGHRTYLTDGAVGTVSQFNLDLLRRVDITKGYRATLCEIGELRARCRRLVGANSDHAQERRSGKTSRSRSNMDGIYRTLIPAYGGVSSDSSKRK